MLVPGGLEMPVPTLYLRCPWPLSEEYADMSYHSNKLNDAKIRQTHPKNKPYKLVDGEGLFLLVKPNGAKYWRLAYRHPQKQKTLALARLPENHAGESKKCSPRTPSSAMRIFSSGWCFLRVLRRMVWTSFSGVSVMIRLLSIRWMYQKSPLGFSP